MMNRVKQVIHDISRRIRSAVDDWVIRLIEARMNDLTDDEKERLISDLEKIPLKRKQ